MKYQSVSSLKLYNECPARYDLRYNDGIEPPDTDTDSKRRGKAFHAGIEAALKAWLDIQNGTRTTVLIEAANGVMRTCQAEGYSAEVMDDALELVMFYVPRLGIGTAIRPYVLHGKPMVEFDFSGLIDGVGFKGFIDAVVVLPDGKLALVDWKIRDKPSNFFSPSALSIDRQLYLYAAALEHLHGVKVDVITQVQMSASLPARPTLKKDMKGDKASDYSLTISKTTASTLRDALKHLSDDELQEAMLQYIHKIESEDQFIQSTRLDVALVEPMLDMTLDLARRINSTERFLPILDGYQCKGCAWQSDCRAKYLGVTQL
jgi:RecB family exonuclease